MTGAEDKAVAALGGLGASIREIGALHAALKAAAASNFASCINVEIDGSPAPLFSNTQPLSAAHQHFYSRNPIMENNQQTEKRMLTVRISRGTDEAGYTTYSIPWRENQTVLDVVTEVQRRHEPTLSYRFACRVGVCGSCAMTVNGKPRWTCRTHVSRVEENGEIVIEPLRNMPRIKDLVVDMSEFFAKWKKAGNTFVGTTTRNDPPANVSPQSRNRKRADAAIECINCGVCYAACDVVAWDKEYLGPAALNRAWTLVNDERHADTKDVVRKATSGSGCNSCHTQGSCMTYCPVSLSPTGSIAGLKKSALMLFLKGG